MLYLAIERASQAVYRESSQRGPIRDSQGAGEHGMGAREFLAEVRELGCPEGGVAVILEVCGLNEWLLKLLAGYGYSP